MEYISQGAGKKSKAKTTPINVTKNDKQRLVPERVSGFDYRCNTHKEQT